MSTTSYLADDCCERVRRARRSSRLRCFQAGRRLRPRLDDACRLNRDHTLKTLIDKWPGADLVYELMVVPGQRILGLAHRYTEDERGQLSNVAVSTLVETDGRVFKPAGGLTTAGTSINASRAADAVMIRVLEWEEALNADRVYFDRFAAKRGLKWPSEPEFEFGFVSEHKLGFVERTSRLAFGVT